MGAGAQDGPRYVGQSQLLANRTQFPSGARHPVDHTGAFVLANRCGTCIAKGQKSFCAVAAHAGQQGCNDIGARRERRMEKRVN